MTTFAFPRKTFVFSFFLYHILMDQTRRPLWPLPQSSADPVGAKSFFALWVSLGLFDRAERLAIHSCQPALLLLCHPDCLYYLTSREIVQLQQPQLSVCLLVGQLRLTIRTYLPLPDGGLAENLKHRTTTERTVMQNYCKGTQSSPERNPQHDPLGALYHQLLTLFHIKAGRLWLCLGYILHCTVMLVKTDTSWMSVDVRTTDKDSLFLKNLRGDCKAVGSSARMAFNIGLSMLCSWLLKWCLVHIHLHWTHNYSSTCSSAAVTAKESRVKKMNCHSWRKQVMLEERIQKGDKYRERKARVHALRWILNQRYVRLT